MPRPRSVRPSASIEDLIRLFLDHRRRKRRAPATVALYAIQLDGWSRWRQGQGCAPALRGVDLAELRAYFAHLQDVATPGRGLRRGDPGLAAATVRGHYRTLRVLWRWLEHEEDAGGRAVLAEHQRRFFRNDRIALPELSRREQPGLGQEAYEALLAAAEQGIADEDRARDALILRLLWETGLRVHELAGLVDRDVDQRARTARLVGKGDKEGVVFFGPAGRAALRRYLRVRRGRPGGPLLRGVSSRNDGGPVTPNLIRCLVKRLARRAGVDLPPGSPCHCFRRAFARRARAGGATAAEVGELLRDDSPAVVRGYLGLDAGPRRQIYDRVFGVDDGQTRNR